MSDDEPTFTASQVFWITVFAVAMTVLAFILPSHAHDAQAIMDESMGDPRRAAWFESLKQPGTNSSCCNLSDCHRTEARQLPGGKWIAVIEDHYGTRWIPIPPERVVHTPKTIDGDAYICNSNGTPAGWQSPPPYGGASKPYWSDASAGTLYCFVPPIPGY